MIFSENGIGDALVGAELFRALEISASDLASPQVQGRVREIAEFLGNQQDPLFTIGRVKNNKSPHMSNLEYLHGYVQLQKSRERVSKELEKLNKDISFYE